MMVRGLTVLNVRIKDLVKKCLYEALYVIINSLSVQQCNEHNFHALQVLISGVCKDITHCFPCDEEGHLPGQMWNADNCTSCTCSKGTTPIVCEGTLGAGRCTKDLNSLAQSWSSIYRQPCWYSHGIIIKYKYLTNEKVWAIFTVNLELCIRAMIMLSYKMSFEPDLVM